MPIRSRGGLGHARFTRARRSRAARDRHARRSEGSRAFPRVRELVTRAFYLENLFTRGHARFDRITRGSRADHARSRATREITRGTRAVHARRGVDHARSRAVHAPFGTRASGHARPVGHSRFTRGIPVHARSRAARDRTRA